METKKSNPYAPFFRRELGDKQSEGEAACGLGTVYQQMCEYSTALRYHQLDLKIAGELTNPAEQGRAHGNISLAYESLGNFEQAVTHGEQHLSIAAQMNDKVGWREGVRVGVGGGVGEDVERLCGGVCFV